MVILLLTPELMFHPSSELSYQTCSSSTVLSKYKQGRCVFRRRGCIPTFFFKKTKQSSWTRHYNQDLEENEIFFFLDQLYISPKSGCCVCYPVQSTISSSQQGSFLDLSLFLSIPVSGENVSVLKIHTVFMLGLPQWLSGERIHL